MPAEDPAPVTPAASATATTERLGTGAFPAWDALARRTPLDPRAPVLLALSGGADSVFLLRTICAARPRPALFALHVDHGLRGAESAADARFCHRLALAHGVPLRCARVELDGSAGDLERRAREARYGILAEHAQELGLEWVLTAHHADDALETLLMRWLRGTTLEGLAGLRAVAPLPVSAAARGGLRVARPLFALRAGEIRRALCRAGQAWREDASNASTRFTRNRVRHQLLPLLEGAVGPSVSADLFAFQRAAAALRDALDLACPESSRPAAGDAAGASLARAPLTALSTPVLRQHLWSTIVSCTGRAPGARALRRTVDALRAGERGQWTLRGAWTLRLSEDRLELRLPPGRTERRPAEGSPAGDFIPGSG